ncbi:pentatricopeptide repeat-containing protein [Pyrus ussuriensis x Pyrus communis]|uniref:Pentatricopeptide repeat-containing protein n=1 Tax=Pyrus ussuriensis x Pyrus communis TaxID=2448454 RepID=A0A5N5HLB3_9ROSA|nr:pentatricopeptide repeat-containing protein [Pyrus ussuriensis x Pyrus communis]
MRHGRPFLVKDRHHHGASQLGDILLVVAITDTLSTSGTRNLPEPHTQSVPAHTLPLSEPLLLQILRAQFLHPSRKLEFFIWCSLTHNIKHSARTASRSGFLHEVPQLLHSMKEDGVVVDSRTFKALLDAFIRSSNSITRLKFWIYGRCWCWVETDMYNSVLVALVRKNQVGLATAILFKLLEGGDSIQVPNSIACNELLVALRKSDMIVELSKFLISLERVRGLRWILGAIIFAIHAFGCWEMKDSNLDNIGPDLSTYNSLIHVLCLVGKVNDALTIWEELKAPATSPDAITYRILIQGCCRCYRIDDATKIFSEMQLNGYIPGTIVYNSLLDGLFKARKVNDGCQLFEKMVQNGVRASTWTYNILIDGLFRNGRAEAAYTLFCDLKKKGQLLMVCKWERRGFTVDLVTISSLVIGLYKEGRWDWTEKLMKHIRDGNLVPSVLKWKVDMEASLKNPERNRKDYTPLFPCKGDLSEIMSLIKSAKSTMDADLESEAARVKEDDKNLSTDTDQWSSSPHMDQLANQLKSTDHSSRLFSLSRGQRVQVKGESTFDIDMVNTFLSLFLAKGKLSIACKLFEIFSDLGENPVKKVCPTDIATYNVIIQGLGKMGRADLASSVLDKLIKQGGYLDVVMYNTLINALGKASRIDEVNKLFEQMKSSGINPDVVTFNTLIEVHSKADFDNFSSY